MKPHNSVEFQALKVIEIQWATGMIEESMAGFVGLSASAQVPDKPALAWVACPGILHRS